MASKCLSIVEDAEQLDVSPAELRHLKSIKVIYWCPGCAYYHVNPDLATETPLTMDDIEQELKDRTVEKFTKSLKNRRFKRC